MVTVLKHTDTQYSTYFPVSLNKSLSNVNVDLRAYLSGLCLAWLEKYWVFGITNAE